MANSCEFVVGKLLEIRVADGYRSVGDIDAMIQMIRSNMTRLGPNDKMVIVADWTTVHVMNPETAARAREMLATVNPKVARSSILTAPENPTTNLQVVRLIREAQNADRKHFTEPKPLEAWLSPVLSAPEVARLRTFLGLA
jgi:hypothetical protein